MKFIKKSPLFFILLSTGILFSLLAFAGKDTLYEGQELNLMQKPLLTVLFTGMNEGIYPWQLFTDTQSKENEAVSDKQDSGIQDTDEETDVQDTDIQDTDKQDTDIQGGQETEEKLKENAEPSPIAAVIPTQAPTPEPTPYSIKNERLAPLRESSREEYLNHISADIYGDAGVKRAGEYAYHQVEESYFDNTLFIGDSRTVGLRDYTDLREHADFLCETSLTVYKVLEEEFSGMGTLEEVLTGKNYDKIYLMLGINELGRGTTEDYMEQYTKVVDKIHELAPEAVIVLQATMNVSKEKSEDDKIFNNSNITARNHAIATLADNIQVFYIDVNEAVCDASGYLNPDYTYDQIHLLGVYNDIWKQFLLSHGVEDGRNR